MVLISYNEVITPNHYQLLTASTKQQHLK